jgi:hypothetical protein
VDGLEPHKPQAGTRKINVGASGTIFGEYNAFDLKTREVKTGESAWHSSGDSAQLIIRQVKATQVEGKLIPFGWTTKFQLNVKGEELTTQHSCSKEYSARDLFDWSTKFQPNKGG